MLGEMVPGDIVFKAVDNVCSSVVWISNGPIAGGIGNEADKGVFWGKIAVLDLALEVYYLLHSCILNQACLLSNSVEFYRWLSYSP